MSVAITIKHLREAGCKDADIVKIFEIMQRGDRKTYGAAYRPQDLTGECAVYCFVNPLTKKFFYIGISKYPEVRFKNHKNDRCSSAHEELNALLSQGIAPDRILKVYKVCKNRNEALKLEHKLIISTPYLLNRDRQPRQHYGLT
jgi:predicted GIY-YIG superfamily endonuclease